MAERYVLPAFHFHSSQFCLIRYMVSLGLNNVERLGRIWQNDLVDLYSKPSPHNQSISNPQTKKMIKIRTSFMFQAFLVCQLVWLSSSSFVNHKPSGETDHVLETQQPIGSKKYKRDADSTMMNIMMMF